MASLNAILLAVLILTSLPATQSTAASLERLTLGWSAIAGSQAPFWITKEAGLFDALKDGKTTIELLGLDPSPVIVDD